MSIGPRIGLKTGFFSLLAGGVGSDQISVGNTTMSLDIVDDSDPCLTLGLLTYTCSVTNTGMVPLVVLSLVVTLDANTTYVGSTAGDFTGGISAFGQVVTAINAGAVQPGHSASCTITVATPATAMTLTTTGIAMAANAPNATDSETTSVLLVAKDGTSGIRVPTGSSQWASVMSVAGIASGGPSLLWACQEAAGSLADTIGTFTGTTGGSLTYNQAETGWTRKSLKFDNGGTGFAQNYNAGGMPDISTTSQILLIYANVTTTAPATTKMFGLIGYPIGAYLYRTNTSGFVAVSGDNQLAAPSNPTGQMRPYLLRVNRTNSTMVGFNDLDKVTPTFKNTMTGKLFCIGQNAGFTPECSINYAVSFFAGAAELSDAQVKRLLQVLGWTVAWS